MGMGIMIWAWGSVVVIWAWGLTTCRLPLLSVTISSVGLVPTWRRRCGMLDRVELDGIEFLFLFFFSRWVDGIDLIYPLLPLLPPIHPSIHPSPLFYHFFFALYMAIERMHFVHGRPLVKRPHHPLAFILFPLR